MAQNIDKQKRNVSSTINALKWHQTWRHHPHGVLMQPREKIDELNDTQKCVFWTIAQNFLLVGCRPLYFQRIIFLATKATTYSTYRLGAVASLKFLAIENMTPHFWSMSLSITTKRTFSYIIKRGTAAHYFSAHVMRPDGRPSQLLLCTYWLSVGYNFGCMIAVWFLRVSFRGEAIPWRHSRHRGSHGRCHGNHFRLSIYGLHIGATWRIRLNRPRAAVMPPYVILL